MLSWVCSHSLIQSTLISDWLENVPLNLWKVSKCFNFTLFSLLYSLLAWVYFLFQFWKAFHWKCHWTWLQFILITWAWSESWCGKDVYEGQPLWKTGDQSFSSTSGWICQTSSSVRPYLLYIIWAKCQCQCVGMLLKMLIDIFYFHQFSWTF